jgi:alkanesulfonate monooxygenase SsuD/methylene tetrahydromethanopterin reductase-like flavin-dependent oxidoreductase (luciferase family)
MPALAAGAAAAGRERPPLVAHMWVALGSAREEAVGATRQALASYARLPFYVSMFAAAGYPIEDGAASEALAEQLVAYGDESAVAARLADLLGSGLDELLLTPTPIGDAASVRSRLVQLVGGLT